MDSDDLYCKVYVAGVADAASLKAALADITGGSVQGRCISTPPLEVDVFDQSRHMPADAGDDFVRWPFYLEVGATAGAGEFAAWLAALAALLNNMAARGLRVVASGDFENELAAKRRAASA